MSEFKQCSWVPVLLDAIKNIPTTFLIWAAETDWWLRAVGAVGWNKQSCLLAPQVVANIITAQHTSRIWRSYLSLKFSYFIYILYKVLTTYFMNKIASPILTTQQYLFVEFLYSQWFHVDIVTKLIWTSEFRLSNSCFGKTDFYSEESCIERLGKYCCCWGENLL